MKKIIALIVLVFGLAAVAEAGPIYVYDTGGVLKFSSKPPPAGVKAKVFTSKNAKFSWYQGKKRGSSKLFPGKYGAIIKNTARAYRLDPSLIKAVIHAESAFNPAAVSKKGAKGLMQLMPSNIKIYGVSNPFSPQDNIRGGAGLLAKLMRKYKGNIRLALAAYNAGEGAVERYGGVPPFQETRSYVPKVINLYHRYRAAS